MTKTAEIVEKKVDVRTKIVVVAVGLIVLAGIYFISNGKGLFQLLKKFFDISHRLIAVALFQTPSRHGEVFIILFVPQLFLPLPLIAPDAKLILITVARSYAYQFTMDTVGTVDPVQGEVFRTQI